MWDIVCLVLIIGFLIIEAYSLGLKNGQKLKNEEKITTVAEPIIKTIDNFNISKNEKFNKEDLIEWENINNYNGSSEYQKDFE